MVKSNEIFEKKSKKFIFDLLKSFNTKIIQSNIGNNFHWRNISDSIKTFKMEMRLIQIGKRIFISKKMMPMKTFQTFSV